MNISVNAINAILDTAERSESESLINVPTIF